MSFSKNSTVYDSLPPQISGKKLGQIHVKFPKLLRNDGKPNVGFRVKFEWWGQRSEATILAIPWKAGQPANEAIFPVRVDRGSLEGYFSDMETLHMSIHDADNNLYGLAYLPLSWLTNNNLAFDGMVNVKRVGPAKNAVVAELHVYIVALYDAMRKQKVQQVLEGKQITNVDVFQRMEALVVTDTSQKYSDWPSTAGKTKFRPVRRSGSMEPTRRNVQSLLEPTDSVGLSDDLGDECSPRSAIPLLARRAAARRRLAGLPGREEPPVYTGPLSNSRSDIDTESVSLATTADTTRVDGSRRAVFPQKLQNAASHQQQLTQPTANEGTDDRITSCDPNKSNVAAVSNASMKQTDLIEVIPTRAAILANAEALLTRVKGAMASNTKRAEQGAAARSTDRESMMMGPEVMESINDWASALTKANTLPSGTIVQRGRHMIDSPPKLIPSSKHDEVEWLLRGVPEVLDDDAYIEDEVVDRLIQQGGLPPSQLAFPSLYEANQRTLKSLAEVKRMQLTLSCLTIHSARYGLRKRGSYIVIHCPSGCKGTSPGSSDARSVAIDLPDFQAARGPETGKHKNVLKDYVVGQVNVDISMMWNVLLTDGLLKDWLNPSTSHVNSFIHIELYSHLSPPVTTELSRVGSEREGRAREAKLLSTSKAAWTSPALLLGFADIPLDNLLSTTGLTVHVTSDIVVDRASQASIADRLQRLPTGISLRTAKPLGDSMGHIMCTLSLLNENDELVMRKASARPKGASRADKKSAIAHHTKQELTAASSVDGNRSSDDPGNIRTVIDDALDYTPNDAFIRYTHRGKCTRVSRSPEPLLSDSDPSPVYVGIALHFVTISLDDNALGHLRLPIRNEPVRVVVSYKIAMSNGSIRDEMDVVVPAQKFTSTKPFEIEYSSGRIHEISDMMTWRYVYFEVWLKWRGVVHPETEESKLLGLAKFPVHTNIGEPVQLYIADPARGCTYGHVNATVQFHHKESSKEAEKLLEKCLTSESVRRMLRTDRIYTVDTSKQISSRKAEKPAPAADVCAASKIEDEHVKMKHASMAGILEVPEPENCRDKERMFDVEGKLLGDGALPEPPDHHIVNTPHMMDIAPPKSCDDPDLTLSLRASARRSDSGKNITSFTGSLMFSQDSLFGGNFRASFGIGGADIPASLQTDTAVCSSMDSLEKPASPFDMSVAGDERMDGCSGVGVSENKGSPSRKWSTREDEHLVAKHILDICVVDSFSRLWNQYARLSEDIADDPLGCFVCYRFPGLKSADVESWNSVRLVRCGKYIGWLCLWWDTNCSVLNSRNRHEFEVPDGVLPLASLGFDTTSEHVDMMLIPSDSEGNMPLVPICVGKARLSLSALSSIVNRAGYSQTLALPVTFLDVKESVQYEPAEVKVTLSHRIVPASLQKRRDAHPEDQPRLDHDHSIPQLASSLVNESADTCKTLAYGPPHSLIVKVDCVVHLPEHEYSCGEKNVYVMCALKSSGLDRAIHDHHPAKFSTSLKSVNETVVWNEIHNLTPMKSGLETPPVRETMDHFRSCCLMATLYSRPEWKLPKNVQHTEPQRLQIGDICIASATVDLSTLAAGFPYIEGWYHLLDDNQRCIGQIKLTVFQKGSVVVPSDFYDYVDSALELSDGIAEMTESRQDTATVDEEVHGHKREDEGMSMTLLLRDLMAGLEDSTNALIGRGGGAANRTHFPLDETPDDLNVTNSSAGSEAESGDVEGRETDSSGDEKLLLLWGDDEYCEGGIDANDSLVQVVGDEKYDNSEHDLSRIYDDYKRSSPVGYGDGSLEGSTRWTDDNTDITDGHRGEQDDLEEDDNMDDQENGWIEDSTGIKDAMSVRSSVTAEYNVHVNQSKNDALNGVSSDSEDYLNDPFEAYDADEGSDLPIIEYPSYCDTDRRNDEGDGDRSGSPVLEKGGEHCDLSVIVSDGLMSVKSLTEDNEEDEEEELNMGNSVDEVDEDDNEDGGRNVAQDSTLSLLSLSAESPEVSMDMEMVPHANVIDDYPTEVESPEESDPSVKFVYEEGTLTISQTLAEAHVNEERERSHLREAVETFDIFESISKMVLRENDGRINQPEKTLPLEDSCNLRTEMKTISDIVKSVMSDRSGSNGAPWTANPGKRRRFVDAETDRISKAMLSSINSYGRSTY